MVRSEGAIPVYAVWFVPLPGIPPRSRMEAGRRFGMLAALGRKTRARCVQMSVMPFAALPAVRLWP